MPAIQYTKTATSDAAWDGPANEARLNNDGDEAYFRKAFAWRDPDKSGDTKDSFKFIHHEVGSDGEIGAANLAACSTGIGVLNGGRTGTTIPDADKAGVHAHLAHHLEDAGRTAPELKSARARRAWDSSEMPPHPHDDMVHEHSHRAADGSTFTHAHAHHHDDGSVGHESDAHDHEGIGDPMDGDEPVMGMGRSHARITSIQRGMPRERGLVDRQERTAKGQIEVRATATGAPMIRGYAAVFNAPTVIEDWFDSYCERVAAGAFAKTIKEGDVRALWNHDPNYVLGRTKSGTLKLSEDNHGLYYEAEPPDTAWARDLCETIRRGDVDGSSFGFRVVRDRWSTIADPMNDGDGDEPDTMDCRDLLEVQLYDVSPVAFPAYPQTDSSVRAALAGAGFDLDALARVAIRAQRGLSLANRDREQVRAAIDYLRRFLPSESTARSGAPVHTDHPPTQAQAAPTQTGHAKMLLDRLARQEQLLMKG